MITPTIATASLFPHPIPHTCPNFLCIESVSTVSWGLVDNTAKFHVSKAPSPKNPKCLQASNGASSNGQVAVGALLFDGRATLTVDVAEGLEATCSRET